MPAAQTPGSRVFVRFPQDQFDQFEKWSQLLGLPMSYLVAICAWTGSHILIPRMLPNVHQQLVLIKEQDDASYWEAVAEAQAEISEKERMLFDGFEEHRQEFLKWRQERGLHKDD